MIKYDNDGATLIDGNGKRVTVWESVRYSDLVTIMAAQLAAVQENAHTLDMYMGVLHNAQVGVDAGRPYSIPAKPQAKVVSDTGIVTLTPFVPALPDLVFLKVTPSTGSIVTPGTQDKNAVMQMQIDLIFRKMFPPTTN